MADNLLVAKVYYRYAKGRDMPESIWGAGTTGYSHTPPSDLKNFSRDSLLLETLASAGTAQRRTPRMAW